MKATSDIAGALSTRAMLATVKISQWSAKKVDKAVTQETNNAHGAAEDAGRYHKALLAKRALQAVSRAATAARAYHASRTLPWMDDGSRILSSALYFEYTEQMGRIQREFDRAVTEFINDYPTYVEEARQRLADMFDPDDYPEASKIRDGFAMEVRILPVPVAKDFRVQLDADNVEIIRHDIERATRKAMQDATRDAFDRVVATVERMVDKLTAYVPGEDGERTEGIFRDSLINNVRDLTTLLPALNITEDPKLIEITERLRAEVCPHNAEELRENPALRADVSASGAEILVDIEDYIGQIFK